MVDFVSPLPYTFQQTRPPRARPGGGGSVDRTVGRRVFYASAVLASAAGLGTLWRFPTAFLYSGGSTFFILYLFALFTAGFPLLILETGAGNLAAYPLHCAFRSVREGLEGLGWFPVILALVLLSYCGALTGWTARLALETLALPWGEGAVPARAVFPAAGPATAAVLSAKALGPFTACWALVLLAALRGQNAFGRIITVFSPAALLLLLSLFLRIVTTPGAAAGMSRLLIFDPAVLLDPRVWLSAYGQAFFTLGIAAAALAAYGRNLPPRADLTRGAFQATLAHGIVALAATLAVSALFVLPGSSSPGLAGSFALPDPGSVFQAYAAAFELSAAGRVTGLLFFLFLAACAMAGQYHLLHGCAAALAGSRRISRSAAVLVTALPAFLAGALFTAGPPLWLAAADLATVLFGLPLAALLYCLVLGRGPGAATVRALANRRSTLFLGRWWDMAVLWWNPVVLAALLVLSGRRFLQDPSDGFPPPARHLVWVLPVVALAAAAAAPPFARFISRLISFGGARRARTVPTAGSPDSKAAPGL